MEYMLSRTFQYLQKVGNVYTLYGSNEEYLGSFKTRSEALDFSHAHEINKIKRVKRLEREYSKYERCNMWAVS
jgi:hypothetical protein